MLQYLNKRDYSGVILRISAHESSCDFSFKALARLRTSRIYNSIIDKIPSIYVDLYFQKMIYYQFFPIASQIKIVEHDAEKLIKHDYDKIDVSSFSCKSLLFEILKFNKNQTLSTSSKLSKNIKKHARPLFHKFFQSPLLNLNKHPAFNKINLEENNIAVHYVDGFEINKRSDLFWLDKSKVKPSSIIVYYENKHMMKRHDSQNSIAQEYFDSIGVNQVKLWIFSNNRKTPYSALAKSIREINSYDKIDKWLKETAIDLCDKLSFWFSFFEYYNIKIHLDPTESGLLPIIKQIALNELDSVTIGRLRSYPNRFKGSHFGFYPNDIFFSWGEDSSEGLNISNQSINNIIISGFPYKSSLYKSDKEKKTQTEKFRFSQGKKFKILVLDSNHSLNNNLSQVVDSQTMGEFYTSLLEWVDTDHEVSLLIKSKKSEFFQKLMKSEDSISHKLLSDRVEIIRESFQVQPNIILDNVDFVVGISTFMPTAVLECVAHNVRAVFYDYSKLKVFEPDLYKWGHNRVVFSSLKYMVACLKEYKSGNLKMRKLGDWSKNINKIDPFRDGAGHIRIGKYIQTLQKGYDSGKSSRESIDYANEYYKRKWGNNKLFKNNKYS